MQFRFLLICLALTASAIAQESRPAEPVAGLRAEMTPAAPLFDLNAPIRVRFALYNDSNEPIEVPLAAADAGAGLSSGFIFGDSTTPVLRVTTDSETLALKPPAGATTATTLRMAPHAVIGQEVDLRAIEPALRYPGIYKLDWKPLGGRVGTLAAEVRVEGRKQAVIVTDMGNITLNLAYDTAPQNVANFLDLVRSKFYDGKSFHRIVPGEFALGGCPLGNGKGMRPDGKQVVGELTNDPVEIGTVMMALRGGDPNSASCQFFVALARRPDLDGKSTIIGRATDEASIRTLTNLGKVITDRYDRPKRSIVIRSISLIDVEKRPTKVTTP